jgi:glycosyltransferase involved in cell wall biosynthesis
LNGDIDISVVISTYNSTTFLDLTVEKVVSAMNELGSNYELILVDDGSSDSTWTTVVRLASRHKAVRGVRLRNNSGQHSATLCGIRSARGDVVVTLDDDLQHDPAHICELLSPIRTGESDAVFAVFSNLRVGRIRRFGSFLIQDVYRWLGLVKAYTRVSSFRAFSRPVAEFVSLTAVTEPVINAEIVRRARQIANVSIVHNKSIRGTSGYGFQRISRLTRQIVFNYSSLPLKITARLSMLVGIVTAFISFGVVMSALIRTGTAPGWASLFAIVSFTALPILVTLATMSEYLSLIASHQRGDFPYIVQQTTHAD